MINNGQLAYFTLDQRAYKPVCRARNSKREPAREFPFLDRICGTFAGFPKQEI